MMLKMEIIFFIRVLIYKLKIMQLKIVNYYKGNNLLCEIITNRIFMNV